MKILIIWDQDLPKPLGKNLDILENMYPGAYYFAITKEKAFRGYTVIPWESAMSDMLKEFGHEKIPYRWHNPMVFSDWARFWYLSHNANTLYLDCDVRLKRKVLLADKARHSEGNYCIMYTPPTGDGGRLMKILKEWPSVSLLIGVEKMFTTDWSRPIKTDAFQHG